MGDFKVSATKRSFVALVVIIALVWLIIAIACGITGNWVLIVVWLAVGALLAVALTYIYRASSSNWS